jgi:hypothetical protein
LEPVDLRAGARCPNVDTARLPRRSTAWIALDPLASQAGIRHQWLAHEEEEVVAEEQELEVEAGGSKVGAKGRGAKPNKAGLEEYASPNIAARKTREAAAQDEWRIPPRQSKQQPRKPRKPRIRNRDGLLSKLSKRTE